MITATDPIHERLLAGAKSVIGDLALDGLPAERVYVKQQLDELIVTFPCVFVLPGLGEPEQDGEFTDFLSDHVIYPVLVCVGDRFDMGVEERRPVWLGWRHTLLTKFRSLNTIPGVSECFNVSVTPRVVLEEAPPEWLKTKSSFTALCHCMVTRLSD